MNILNYTDKPVAVKLDYDGGEVILNPIATAQLMSLPKEKVRLIADGIPINVVQYGRVTNLPKEDYSKEVMYIVTEDIAKAIGNSRNDLLIMKSPVLNNNVYYNEGLFIYI